MIPEHKVIFHVPERDGLVMQQAAMETGVVCCVGCVRDPPFCPDPFPLWRHTFPRGISHTTSALSFNPRPTHSRRASGLAFLNKGRPHTPAEGVRGHHPSRDALSQSGRVIPKEKILVLTLTGKENKTKHSSHSASSYLLKQ